MVVSKLETKLWDMPMLVDTLERLLFLISLFGLVYGKIFGFAMMGLDLALVLIVRNCFCFSIVSLIYFFF